MNVSEKVAYLKGLMEGLEIDKNSKEGKMFAAILSALEEVASTVEELSDEVDALDTVVDEIDEDLGNLEEEVYSDNDGCGCGCGCDCDCDCCEPYEAECPNCGEVVELSEEDLDNGVVVCPNCKEEFEIELDDEDCDCCCDECEEDK